MFIIESNKNFNISVSQRHVMSYYSECNPILFAAWLGHQGLNQFHSQAFLVRSVTLPPAEKQDLLKGRRTFL